MMAFVMLLCWFLGLVGCPIVATNKRRSAGGWCCAGFFFGVFAFIIVALLPALPDEKAARLEQETTRACPHCLSRIPRAAAVCRHCQRDVPVYREPVTVTRPAPFVPEAHPIGSVRQIAVYLVLPLMALGGVIGVLASLAHWTSTGIQL